MPPAAVAPPAVAAEPAVVGDVTAVAPGGTAELRKAGRRSRGDAEGLVLVSDLVAPGTGEPGKRVGAPGIRGPEAGT